MACPKCGYEPPRGEPGGTASCSRCGVVFAKFGERRQRPPTARAASVPRAEPERRSFSIVNVALLSFVLCGSGLLLWQHYHPLPEPPPGDEPAPAEAPAFDVESAVPAPADPAVLVIPGFDPSLVAPAPEGAAARAAAPEIPSLPRLDASTISLALVERAESLSREYPEESYLREYVAAAYLLLAGKEIRARSFERALGYVDRSERWGAPSSQVAIYRATVHGAQESWELAERWARTALAYGAGANAAEMHHLIGKALYYREELDKAIAEFQQALALGENPVIRASLERAVAEARAAANFDHKRLSHFIVRYEGETMENTGRMVLDTMERSYSSLVSQLGFEPSEPVVVLLYSRRSYREMGGPHWSAGMFDGKIRIPVRGLEHLDRHISATLHHELAHAFIHSRAGERAPRWLHEGLAEYLEGNRGRDGGAVLSKVVREGYSFEHCLPAGSCDVRLLYPAAASLVDYFIQNRGMGGVRDLLTSLGQGEDVDGALRQLSGRGESELIREWEHFVKRRYR